MDEWTLIVEVQPVNMENFKDLPRFRLFPYSCMYCSFWEQLNFDDDTPKEKAEETKRKWFTHVRRKFGNCGFIGYVDNKPVGFAQYAPPEFFPSISKYGNLIPSRDAVFLVCLYVPNRELRGKGIGTQMFEEVTSDLRSRSYGAVEAFARTSDTSSDSIPDWYTGPLEFFLKIGFRVEKKNGQIALVRKELE
jgi:GNAT superfamily N-acetyltransferase